MHTNPHSYVAYKRPKRKYRNIEPSNDKMTGSQLNKTTIGQTDGLRAEPTSFGSTAAHDGMHADRTHLADWAFVWAKRRVVEQRAKCRQIK